MTVNNPFLSISDINLPATNSSISFGAFKVNILTADSNSFDIFLGFSILPVNCEPAFNFAMLSLGNESLPFTDI